MKVGIRVSAWAKKAGGPFWLAVSVFLLLLVGALDYVTGPELSFSLFYLIPIAVSSWGLRGNYGILTAFLSTILWLYIEVISTIDHHNIFIHLWNAIIRLGFFLLPALLLKSLEQERLHARTDFLTGAFNHRHFHEVLQMEVDRSVRYNLTFTVAFIDADNFKAVNDTFGHAFGDETLKTIVEVMKKFLRKTDTIARVGGDEFVILLPETGEQAARTVINNLCIKLKDEMLAKKCPITFSVGVLTLTAPQISTDQILNTADKIMYLVKNNGKDNIRHEVHRETKAANFPRKQSAPPTPPQS